MTTATKTYTLLGADGGPYQGFRPCAACCGDRYQAWKDARQKEWP
ncbi:hypothetical protein Pth03_77190 [Planotetraspora thailandica]|uniref:Uncharacterized protein n=1 Tax=Planotetraspora thailandica TaxID=487172 RepID=A0A8J3Y1U8_9ACTN|nr:hypothetical protein [Planotetraspora thailandica]GII59330.1 hypothetical protein Pth03_77190 [Planotetraspora thailandica]